jgi:hypothetical protein
VLGVTYTGDGPTVLNHNQDPSKVSVVGDPMFAPTVYIIATDKADANDSGALFFFGGSVNLGGVYNIVATLGGRSRL